MERVTMLGCVQKGHFHVLIYSFWTVHIEPETRVHWSACFSFFLFYQFSRKKNLSNVVLFFIISPPIFCSRARIFFSHSPAFQWIGNNFYGSIFLFNDGFCYALIFFPLHFDMVHTLRWANNHDILLGWWKDIIAVGNANRK